MPRKPDPELIDNDAPEATDEWFKEARAAKDVLPGLIGVDAAQKLLKPKRGRPRSENPKEHVNIRLDADVLPVRRLGARIEAFDDSAPHAPRQGHALLGRRRGNRRMLAAG
jgi:uncharacterized protein (DUF4415 family)